MPSLASPWYVHLSVKFHPSVPIRPPKDRKSLFVFVGAIRFLLHRIRSNLLTENLVSQLLQANRRYNYFAQKADVEGHNDVAAVFRSTAEGTCFP
jgi:hypothetical protein